MNEIKCECGWEGFKSELKFKYYEPPLEDWIKSGKIDFPHWDCPQCGKTLIMTKG